MGIMVPFILTAASKVVLRGAWSVIALTLILSSPLPIYQISDQIPDPLHPNLIPNLHLSQAQVYMPVAPTKHFGVIHGSFSLPCVTATATIPSHATVMPGLGDYESYLAGLSALPFAFLPPKTPLSGQL